VSDITSAKLAAQERQELERRYHLAQQHESVAVLAAGVAHEFNNLLLPVVANVDLVAAKLPPTAPERAWLLEARQAALRAAELTQQLLAHSGQGRVVVGPVDLVAFVQEQQTAWAAQVAPPAQWRVRYPAHPLTVNADATQLAQALTNLIANAVEALPEGQGTVTLALDGEYVPDPTALDWRAPDVPAGWYAFVEVSDTGGGIDAETLPRIFEPYFSTKFTGRGLGLAAVTGIVRGHNGLLNVRSRVGHGTAVRLYLLTTTVQPALPPPPSQRGQTILVTDDEDMVRLVVERILQAHGYTTLSAVDGQAALEVFDQTGTDIGLVLLDMTMPRLAGPETLAELRRRVPELPVIVMSGYSEQELTERFAGQSVPRFLKKPFTPTLLLAAVRAALPVTPSPR
jgi:CheY-like chemotaxis protein/nitrogen-specific signal transduction histidine kinase